MTTAKYEQILNEYAPYTTTRKYHKLLSSALEIGQDEKTTSKIQRLTTALNESDERSLAEKIEELYIQKLDLSKTNFSR